MLDQRFCPVCRADTEVELLPCLEGHDGDCDERVCTACSTVVFAGARPQDGLHRAS